MRLRRVAMSGTVEQYGKGWRYRAAIGMNPDTGARRWVSKGGFPTRKAAKAALTAVLADADKGVVVDRTPLKVGEYLDQWLDGVAGDLKPTTLEGYRQAVRRLKRTIGDVKLQDLRPLTVERAYQKLTRSGLAAKTVLNTHTVLRRALGDAERLDMVVRNAAASARPPSVRRKEQATWTPKQLSSFLESIADHRLFAVFVLGATTGMRRGELMGLRWSDVDLDAGRLSVVTTITTVNGRAIESSTKTNKSRRRIALDSGTVGVLRAHHERQDQERQLAGGLWCESGLVFTREDGTALHPDRFSHLFARLMRKANLPPIRLHDLRHTYATLALEAGVHPKIVSERLGHATTGITLDLYSHVAPSMDEQAAEAVAGLFTLPGQSDPSDGEAASA